MSEEKKLLDSMSETADMGLASLTQLYGKAEDPALQNAIEGQWQAYDQLYQEVAGLLIKHGHTAPGANAAIKASEKITSNIKTMLSKEKTATMAEMIAQGNKMGVQKLEQALDDYQGDNPEILGIAHRLLDVQRQGVEQMKGFH